MESAFQKDGVSTIRGYKISLSSGAIYAIYEDKESRKWIGTSKGGVNIIDPQKSTFQTISHEHGNSNSLSYNAISAFCETAEGDLCIGTDGGGLNVWDRKSNSFSSYKHIPGNPFSLSDNAITDIKVDQKQNIWIATFMGGINRFNQSTHRFEHYTCINPTTGAEDKVVFTLYEDKKQQLWAGTLRHGGVYGELYRFNTASNRFEVFDATLSDLFTLNEDRNGTLWGGNLNQLVRIDKISRKHQFYPIGYTVRAILEDRSKIFGLEQKEGG